jgi:hypothetical protein
VGADWNKPLGKSTYNSSVELTSSAAFKGTYFRKITKKPPNETGRPEENKYFT